MIKRLIQLFVLFVVGCSSPSPCGDMDAGVDQPMACDEHPELAQIDSVPCAVDADCPVITACVSIVCGPAGTCIFAMSPPNGTACENGGMCDDRRCCHPLPVGP